MKEVPNVISNKDLLYIKDMLNWNLIMNKKLCSYIEIIDDTETLKVFNKAMKMHYEHFEELLDIFD